MHDMCNVVLFSHVGNSRQNQEDNALLGPGKYLFPADVEAIAGARTTYCAENSQIPEAGLLVAVSDGMGGHASGEVASLMTVKYLSDNYRRILHSDPLGKQVLAGEIAALNRCVASAGQSDRAYSGMGATLCGVVGKDGFYFGFNVGDSRLYRYGHGRLEQLSTDHTEGQRLLKLKLLSEEECARFPRRKNLYKYIGCGGELAADVFAIGQCVPGTILLLCSDGLTDVLSDAEIEAILQKAVPCDQKGKLLIDTALQRNIGHGDNITLMLIAF